MNKLRALLQIVSWADHLDEAGFYRNKRFFIQTVALGCTLLAVFGFDLGATPEEQLSIAGGAMAIVGLIADILTRKVGSKIDEREERLPEERKPRRARRPGSRIKHEVR